MLKKGGIWFASAGSKLSCTTYVQEYFLRQSQVPIAIAIDTVHHLVDSPQIAMNFSGLTQCLYIWRRIGASTGALPLQVVLVRKSCFFAMLRSWYEQARIRADWQKLRLIIAYAAELELPLPANQSPFNVGLPLSLPWLTTTQIKELAERYELYQVGIRDIGTLQPLLDLVGGHPYLLQLAFYWLRSRDLSLTQLLQSAPTTRGIYSEYLRRLWSALQRDDTLIAAFQQVLSNPEPIQLDVKTAYQLEDLGLVQLSGTKVSLRCELYRQYFSAYLESQHG